MKKERQTLTEQKTSVERVGLGTFLGVAGIKLIGMAHYFSGLVCLLASYEFFKHRKVSAVRA